MAKQPRAGRVKTRLGHDIGMTAAAWWYRHRVRDLIRRIQHPGWDVVLSVTPDESATDGKSWPAHLPRVAQGRGDLGVRMGRAIDMMPPGPACLIGTDVPGIRRCHIARAFAALGRHDAVFGPATDGGYWLIGLKRIRPRPRDMFRDVRWSGPHALADTIATLGPLTHATIDTLQDVDVATDLAG